MKPQRINNQQENLFKPSISSQRDPNNPLKLLADQIDWNTLEKALDSSYTKRKRQPAHTTEGGTIYATTYQRGL